MGFFDNIASLDQDDCAILAQDVQNSRMCDYSLYNNLDPYCKTQLRDKVRRFSLENGRSFKDGLGEPAACYLDEETRLERGTYTHPRGRIALSVRVFHDVPYLGRGVAMPDVESQLQSGEFQFERRMCKGEAQRSVNRFEPLLPCIRETIANPRNVVMNTDVERIGEPTRDVDYQRKFLQRSGFEYNGKTWHRKICKA
jgi:hypothetical protein